MKPIRKFLARHVWLLFLLVLAIAVGGLTLIFLYPWHFIAFMAGLAFTYIVSWFFGVIGVITYHLYMKWSLE